jgi:hypothetical protein
MKLRKFRIVSPRDIQALDNAYETMLINLDHVISVKPIKMVVDDKVLEGFWIRTSNGKKYRAVQIPKELIDLLNDDEISDVKIGVRNEDLIQAQLLN